MDSRHQVEQGYDHIAEHYLAGKNVDDPAMFAALEALARDLSPGSTALDIGCGAGVPVTRWLAERFHTTGVDVSARQIELARQYAPNAHFLKADMLELDFAPNSFDMITSFYAIIHVPRAEQPALVRRIYHWLKPDGRFLATWAIDAWEGEEGDWEGWGAPMWWSHYDAGTNLAMLRDAGFEIETTHKHVRPDERWLWVLARKQASL